ncbi:unnamed protein product [Rhizoctonia solani]|uniref:Uncharacterized protein n=1 Tax=Rhizoctonia solani TaxID=456999 RepID=A0A8H3B8D4_9AGAM|nr:unnamed protein product [Rhizoctonia solani]
MVPPPSVADVSPSSTDGTETVKWQEVNGGKRSMSGKKSMGGNKSMGGQRLGIAETDGPCGRGPQLGADAHHPKTPLPAGTPVQQRKSQ